MQIIARGPSPSDAVLRDELIGKVRAALEQMRLADREVLSLRHFEDLSNREAALVLGIEESAAGVRYFRALKKLKVILKDLSIESETDQGGSNA